MAEKPISRKELNERIAKGADVTIHKKPTEIAEFKELVDTLKQMVANEEERVRADLARNQTTLEILGTLQSMIRKQGDGPKIQPVDLSPIYELLEEIRAERKVRDESRGAYEFDIKRDGRGFAQSITATPKAPTTH